MLRARSFLPASLIGLIWVGAFIQGAAAESDERRSQTLTLPELSDRLTTDAPFEVSATASSGLPVALTIVAGPAVLDGQKIRLIGDPGVVIVRATQAGNGAFRPAGIERTFAVQRPPATPAFLTQPANRTIGPGESVSFTAEASGNPPPTYQWRKDGLPIPGATERTYTIPAPTAADAGAYDVVATNPSGSATSAKAALTIGKRAQTITFQLSSPNCMAGQTVNLSGFATSGLPVTFTVVSGSATLTGTLLLTTFPGTVTVRASQDGDSTYAAASPVDQVLYVSANPNPSHPGMGP
jgi:hypothetical protein